MAIAIINQVAADAHARRVTLNMTLNSTVCPSRLKPVLLKLKIRNWQFDALAKSELELIYGLVNEALCLQVLSEYEVTTGSMRDYGFPWWRGGSDPVWFDGVHEVDCRLCGHKHNRYEFLASNTAGGTDIWMGSTCIRKFGLTVDGESTAEAAWSKLSKAMNVSKKAQTRKQWQDDHPDHDAVMNKVAEASDLVDHHTGRSTWNNLPHGMWRRMKAYSKKMKGAVRYYYKNDYLTNQRTADVWVETETETETDSIWTPGFGIKEGSAIVALFRAAEAGQDVRDAKVSSDGTVEVDQSILDNKAHWIKFATDHPNMNSYQRDCILKLEMMAADPANMQERLSVRQATWLSGIVAEVKDQAQKAKDLEVAKASPPKNIELPF